ncbi:MAG: hypothetical protein N3A38_12620 [Planctomycetota bacterium]|nr:hypothetical protein [Planctomycetota bacterium]
MVPLAACWAAGIVCLWMAQGSPYAWLRLAAYNALQICIVGMWVSAMRAIRLRIFELKFYAHVLKKAGAAQADAPAAEDYRTALRRHERMADIRDSIWKLRVVATGITLPFFFVPLFAGLLLVGITLASADKTWWGSGFALCLAAVFVASYYRWVVVPVPDRSNLRRRRMEARRDIKLSSSAGAGISGAAARDGDISV